MQHVATKGAIVSPAVKPQFIGVLVCGSVTRVWSAKYDEDLPLL